MKACIRFRFCTCARRSVTSVSPARSACCISRVGARELALQQSFTLRPAKPLLLKQRTSAAPSPSFPFLNHSPCSFRPVNEKTKLTLLPSSVGLSQHRHVAPAGPKQLQHGIHASIGRQARQRPNPHAPDRHLILKLVIQQVLSEDQTNDVCPARVAVSLRGGKRGGRDGRLCSGLILMHQMGTSSSRL